MDHSSTGSNKKILEIIFFMGVLVIIMMAIIKSGNNSLLEKIRKRETLTIITRNGPTTYYKTADGPTGFEFDLAKAFADYLGVELKIIVPDSFNDIIPMLNGGQADLAAAGLTITENRMTQIVFGPSYQSITQQLIAHIGNTEKITAVSDIKNGYLEVTAGSSHEEMLTELQQQYPALQWTAVESNSIDELIYRVYNRDIDYTISDSNDFTLSRRFYPDLQAVLDLTEPQQLAWAFAKSRDDSLYQEAVKFFAKIKENGTLSQLIDRYYGHIERFDYVGTTVFLEHIETRLLEYKNTFIEAGERYEIDWRLIAAIAYQESHWQTDITSPTGVKGIMMLTLKTASDLNISNRLDANQSILGGTYYFKTLRERIPERILEPDRTWMAIAAYNIGFGHLEDARILAQTRATDPDKWIDIQETLPLLNQPKWYSKTKHGYARGWEPVIYVKNIRSYYEVLVRLDEEKTRKTQVSQGAPPQIPRTL